MNKAGSLIIALSLLAASCSSNLAPTTSAVKIVDKSLVEADLLKEGGFKVIEGDYSSTPTYDPDVLSEDDRTETDIRGRIYMPDGKGPFPIVMFLHGNHSTCGRVLSDGNPRLDYNADFTESGACRDGDIEAPSYRGYDESARLLASSGYVVASINANRGITGKGGFSDFDTSLVYARGNLVLRHLEELSKWSVDGKNDSIISKDLSLKGKIDISRVGLMGHSRGGEGVRYAYNIFNSEVTGQKWKRRIPGLKIGGIFEIGPIDVGTGLKGDKIEAANVPWNVLIPGCDHDVSNFSGIRPYERMLKNMTDGTPKSVFVIWGANHNYFNSQWQVSDAESCNGSQEPLWDNKSPLLPEGAAYRLPARSKVVGSKAQIDLEKALLLAFFESNLSGKKSLGHIFDPQYALPKQLESLAPISREYSVGSDSKSILNPTALKSITPVDGVSIRTLSEQINTQVESISKVTEELFKTKAKLRADSIMKPAVVFEADSRSKERTAYLPFDTTQKSQGYWTLDMVMALRKPCADFDEKRLLNCPAADLDNAFKIALVLEDGTITQNVNVQDYVKLDDWFANTLVRGSTAFEGDDRVDYYNYIPALYQTARFELTDFKVSDQTIKGIQISFTPNTDVSLVLESINLSKRPE